MIEVKITIPNEELAEGQAALARRMAVLGFSVGRLEVRLVTPAEPKAEPVKEAPVQKAEPVEDAPKKRGRPAKAEPAPVANITATPEHRVEPEVEAQDAADEAAEVAPAVEVTAEDLRGAMGEYARKFGMDAALADGPAIFTDALGQPPEGGWKLSVVAATGGVTLVKGVEAWRAAAAAGTRYGQES